MYYWNYKIAPTKYTDDVYHIGSKNAPSWLIKSTDGLILLDTGLPQTLYQILENIREIGFDYHDIKHILHSHGHIDHIGGTRALVEMTGAKTYIGFGDEECVRGNNGLQYTNEFGRPFEEPFEPDFIVKDGDKITIGDKTFLFIATPGHTQGTMSIFFNTKDGDKEYRAGMFGGGGLNTMSRAYLEKYDIPMSIRQDYLHSIDKVFNELVEVHLGNHLGDNRHSDKLERVGQGPNPFIDTTTWQRLLTNKRAEAIKKFEEDN